MASKAEVNPQSYSDSTEKDNVSVNVLVAVLVGIITAGKNFFVMIAILKFTNDSNTIFCEIWTISLSVPFTINIHVN